MGGLGPQQVKSNPRSYRPSLKMELKSHLAAQNLLSQFQDFEESEESSDDQGNPKNAIHQIDEEEEYNSEDEEYQPPPVHETENDEELDTGEGHDTFQVYVARTPKSSIKITS